MSESQRVELTVRLSPMKLSKNDAEDDESLMNISDEDLYHKLKKYDSNIGPVTRSTRKLYAKKLQKFLNNSQSSPNSKTTSSSVHEVEKLVEEGGAGDAQVTSQHTSDFVTKTTKVYSRKETPKNTSPRFFREKDTDDDEDDGGLVESDEDENKDTGLFRSYPASFCHLSSASKSRASEIQALLKSANETLSESNKSVNDTLSSFKYAFADYSDDENLVSPKVEKKVLEIKRQRTFDAGNGAKARVNVVKRLEEKVVENGSWCGCLFKLLVFVMLLTTLLLCVLAYKSLDKDYNFDIKPEEWVKWAWKGVRGGWRWLKGVWLVGWVGDFLNDLVIWVKDFELIG